MTSEQIYGVGVFAVVVAVFYLHRIESSLSSLRKEITQLRLELIQARR